MEHREVGVWYMNGLVFVIKDSGDQKYIVLMELAQRTLNFIKLFMLSGTPSESISSEEGAIVTYGYLRATD